MLYFQHQNEYRVTLWTDMYTHKLEKTDDDEILMQIILYKHLTTTNITQCDPLYGHKFD